MKTPFAEQCGLHFLHVNLTLSCLIWTNREVGPNTVQQTVQQLQFCIKHELKRIPPTKASPQFRLLSVVSRKGDGT